MTDTKWLRQALLGSVALGVMATGAQADELTELKAQLEGLQSRVNQLEQQPTYAALPEGASFLTMSRGSAQFPNYGTQLGRDASNMPANRGFTIAVTPTADLPAPISEVVVYGFVKGDVIYDFDKDLGDSFTVPALWSSGGEGGKHVRLHARQSRFGIRSRTDTAIGQIRTQIEGDFFSEGNRFRLRHAYGEWDMTPTWTFLAGQTTSTASLHPIGVNTVDFAGSAGPNNFPRRAQVRMTYHSGPISWAVAAEAPDHNSSAQWPNLASYIQFDAPGGHQFIVTGALTDADRGFFEDDDGDGWFAERGGVGWAVQAGANINLADIATLTVGGLYGENGAQCTYLAQHMGCGLFNANKFAIPDFVSDSGWGVLAGLSFGLTDTTTFNVQYGITHLDNDKSEVPFDGGFWAADSVMTQTVHANILWRPVQQMQLGWEVMWGQYDFDGGSFEGDDFCDECVDRKDDAIRAQFGAWFFF